MKTKRLKLINTIQLTTFISLFLMTTVIVVLQLYYIVTGRNFIVNPRP